MTQPTDSAARSMGAIVPPEVACRCVGLCTGDLQPEDLGDPSKWCRHCGFADPYSPCPRLGFGCGTGAKDDTEPCDCCAPEEWKRAKDGT